MSDFELHNLDAEQGILGSLLVDNKVLWEIEDMGLRPDQFYDPVHGRLYQTITESVRAGSLADAVTLSGKLKDDEGLKEIGGLSYLADLMLAAVEKSVIRDYLAIVIDLSTRREIVRVASEAIAAAQKPAKTNDAGGVLLEETARQLTALETGSEYRSVSASEAISEALNSAQQALKEGAAPNGISTGLKKLSTRCGLLKAGMLITVAGRPGMGKSTVALDIGLNMAKEGVGVGYLSPEMDASEHGYRMASSLAFSQGVKIPYEEVASGKINSERLRQIAGCVHAAKKLPFVIDDRGVVPYDRLAMRVRALDRQLKQRFQCGLQVLVIDHLGLIDPPKMGFGGNRVQEVSLITKMLKQLARTMGIVIILLSQLNREVEKREDKRPKLADLRESGSIEQDSDQVWLLYREAYYLQKEVDALRAAGKADSMEYDAARNRLTEIIDDVEIDVAKRRGGAGGRDKVKFYAAFSAIRDFPDSSDEFQSDLMEAF